MQRISDEEEQGPQRNPYIKDIQMSETGTLMILFSEKMQVIEDTSLLKRSSPGGSSPSESSPSESSPDRGTPNGGLPSGGLQRGGLHG